MLGVIEKKKFFFFFWPAHLRPKSWNVVSQLQYLSGEFCPQLRASLGVRPMDAGSSY